ncbi:MAG TPA: tRNA guanosine(34) transglycosylase Tgt, partial [Isosphaeraceae bacterium]|nr:tRNA guanosine(34) transglycosylase Tgt [Isosphaeraceae bacterium]
MPTQAVSASRPPVRFTHLGQDTGSGARRGRIDTPSGSLETPAFMPVGTQATIKGLTPDQLHATGTRMLLANTYHLALRPGERVVAAIGGLHTFMGWEGPILTDSGGFQVFSLSARNRVTDQGVTFRSHLDGRLLELTPEHATTIQEQLGADVAMCLDHCPALPASKTAIADAVERTIAWAKRCKAAHTR